MSEDPLRALNDCGCCEGTSVETPVATYNRPGLRAIVYRVGTHPQFRESLLARLSAAEYPPLRGLRTRDDTDFTIAYLDAFAAMADVLTFYQERIANESYLRTATERRSILELARLIGYELRPGVAANAEIAFTIDDAPGAFGRALSTTTTTPTAPEKPPVVPIAIGTRLQTIPGPGEKPQFFETIEEIEARAEWNAMKPRLSYAQTIAVDMTTLYVSGVDKNIQKGDRILIAPSGADAKLRIVKSVALDAAANLTTVTFSPLSPADGGEGQGEGVVQQEAPLTPTLSPQSGERGQVADYVSAGPLTGSTLTQFLSYGWTEDQIAVLVAVNNWNRTDLTYRPPAEQEETPDEMAGVFIFSQRASLFGHNAPNWGSLPLIMRFPQATGSTPAQTTPPYPNTWEGKTLEGEQEDDEDTKRHIDLDRAYEKVVEGGWVYLECGDDTLALPIENTEEINRSDYTLSGKSTRLHVDTDALTSFTLRETTVLVESEKLPLAEVPDTEIVRGDEILLGKQIEGLTRGRKVFVTGEVTELEGKIVSELATIRVASTVPVTGLTLLTLDDPLENEFVRDTVTLNANVASATHGETVTEILGSGDGTQPFQRFTLRQPPLTYVGARNETGAATTLEVRVNDLLWTEVPSFFGRGPEERIYVTRRDDEGKTTVIFGDGTTGARLPTGANNVTANYRRGIGAEGLVNANQISQLMTRPLGVKGATNPLDSADAADPESIDDARRNAGLTALTLGRVVSLRDYEDFSRSYAGIDKASARWTWKGEQREILVTVAGTDGAAVEENSDLQLNLLASIRKLGDPHVALRVVSYASRRFCLAANVLVDPAYIATKVLDEVRATLLETFSFDARAFGQPVHRSEIEAVVSAVKGVVAVNVYDFRPCEQSTPEVKPRIGADPVSADAPARLLLLEPSALTLGEMR